MTDVAALITAIGGALGAIIAGIAALIAARRGSDRETEAAVQAMLQHYLRQAAGDDDDFTPGDGGGRGSVEARASAISAKARDRIHRRNFARDHRRLDVELPALPEPPEPAGRDNLGDAGAGEGSSGGSGPTGSGQSPGSHPGGYSTLNYDRPDRTDHPDG